jgi:hypothetical protein
VTSAQPEQITVTDPRHPLYGHSFTLVSVPGVRHGTGHAYVDDRGHGVLRVPVVATNLHPAARDLPTSKLTLGAIRDLVRLAAQEEPAWRSVPRTAVPACPRTDAEPARRSRRHLREGEP